ncbi:SDR family oxidoreductase [Oleispirillum naphthae]|uniref:SDR family oxidoreductase n=1 Tax=Oleispirillum naphthae TaxID=2838853 RepID=UPI0030826754
MTTPHLLIFGLGYTGLRLARECLAAGWRVSGTVRGPEKAARLAADRIAAYPFTPGETLPEAELAAVTHVLDTTVPDAAGAAPLPEILRLSAAGVRPVWAGMLSSTAVYGDCAGRWVDETARPNPGSAQGRARLLAETQWLTWGAETATATHIFRLPGLYGPGRSALDAARDGTARRIHRAGHRTSRVHVDDVVAALRLSMAAPSPGRIYNVADDEPAPNAAVVDFACALLGVEPPPLERYEDLAPTDPRLRFLKESRLVSSARLKAELGWTPRYPSYREGLQAAFAEG